MAHLRKRTASPQLLKELKFWPVVNLFGPRQAGKSTLLRELTWRRNEFSYVSLDHLQSRQAAQKNPEQFLSQFSKEPIVIDEAHKAPDLFDEIKARVDERRKPGRFVLSGSILFSKKIGIRESLTGRSASIHLDTMSYTETTDLAPNLKTIHRYLEKGGMPGVCFLRDPNQVQNYWNEWLETSCHRDLIEMNRGRLSGDLAIEILEQCALLEMPMIAEIAKALRVDSRRIQSHLSALESLFLVRRLEPSRVGVGKPLFFPFDCGLANFFNAGLRRRWQIWMVIELTKRSLLKNKKMSVLRYHKTVRGSLADLIDEKHVYLFSDEVYPRPHTGKTITALERNYPKYEILFCAATDQPMTRYSERTLVVPWSRAL